LLVVALLAAAMMAPAAVAGATGSDGGVRSALGGVGTADPPFPTIRARLVKTKPGPPYYGRDHYSVRYCFARWSADPARRPWRLHLGIDNLSDDLPPLSLSWELKSRCGTIMQPTPRTKRPWVMKVNVETYSDLSRTKVIRLR
jgi:hypothetical protein